MGTFETIVLAGLVLGVAQLAAGVAIGLWFGRRRAAAGSADWRRAQRLATDLDTLASRVAHSVGDHSDRVAHLSDRLGKEASSGGQLTELVVGVVGELLTANGRLVADLQQSRQELSERLDELAEHREQALTDALTGLPNRRAFDGHLGDRIDAWRKRQTPFSLMMIDVDRFKQFNDTHGHQAGDEALRTVAGGLREALRSHDVVARYGGEEFAVLLPHTELEAAAPAVEKVLRSVARQPIATPSGEASASVSIGVATIEPQERGEALVERADSALYAAKQNGRNRAWAHAGEGGLISLVVGGDGEPAGESNVEADPATDIEQACDALSASLADFLEAAPSDASSSDPSSPVESGRV